MYTAARPTPFSAMIGADRSMLLVRIWSTSTNASAAAAAATTPLAIPIQAPAKMIGTR